MAISTLSQLYREKTVAAAAINILSKLQFANEAIPLMEGDSYASHPPYGSRLEWLKNGYFPVKATHYFEAREENGDWVCRVKVLGGGSEDKKTQVIHLLVQMSAGARDEMKAVSGFVDDEFGVGTWGGNQSKIFFPDGKSYDLDPRVGKKIHPGFMKIVTYEISGIKKKNYGISRAGNPKAYDPTDLSGIELAVPGEFEWFVVPVTQE